MRITKCFSVLITMILVMGLLAACGNNDKDSEGEKTTTGNKTNATLTLTAASDWLKPVDEEIITDFTNETGIKVDVQVIPADQYASVLKAKLASGEGPDISIVWAQANAAQFQPAKNFLDLSDQEWVGRLTESAKKNATFDDNIIGWGSQGGDSGWGLMYNKAIFKQYNIEVPKTYAEFLTVSETLLSNGVTPVYEPLKDSWHTGIWFALMGPLGDASYAGLFDGLNDNTTKFADVKQFETFLEQYKELYSKGYFGKDALTNSYDKHMVAMDSSKYAMTMVPANEDIQSKGKGETYDFTKYGMFPAPFVDNKALAVYDGSLIRVINKASKNIDAAKQYLDYISRKDVLEKYYTATGVNPAFSGIPTVEGDIEKSLRENSDGTGNTIMESGIKFWDNTSTGNYVIEMMLDGKTVKEVLEAIDKDRGKLFSALQ